MVFVLPDAEMDVQRCKLLVFIEILSVEFHVVVAAAQRFRPKHVALRRVAERAGLVVFFVQAKGETPCFVFPDGKVFDSKCLAFRNVCVDVENMRLQWNPCSLLVLKFHFGEEPLDFSNQELIFSLVCVA